ncbi:MAG: hypothetical protein IT385_23950 [Deltaproteobacteria bacterium]|nr:hypothetical protein [Deltaproteobacteria bacterium]
MTIVAAALGLAAPAARAQPAQGPSLADLFMFYGFAAPEGSVTSEGAGTQALYLFWGTDDADLATIGADADVTLERDGQVVLGPFRFGDVMSEAQIAALYAAPSQGRRLAETMRALDDMFPADPVVTPQTFPARLRAALLGQGDCAGLGMSAQACAAALRSFGESLARVDANVAAAVFNGYRTALPSTTTTWVLRATDGATTRVLGSLTIDPASAAWQAGPAASLVDVSHEQQRCDAPGLAAHGTLALSWANPSLSPATDKLESHKVAGYHVFAGACTGPTTVDLGALAAGVAHDTHGRFTLPGLTRLTDVPVQVLDLPPVDPVAGRRLSYDPLIQSNASWTPPPGYANPTTPGWRPTFAQLGVDAGVVAAAGFQPGQSVCVHVAAIDRAGQLGRTASIQARVASYEKPPSPWDVETVLTSEREWNGSAYVDTDTFALEWPAIDVASWLARDGGVACNPPEAAATGRLRYAPSALECGQPAIEATVALGVEGYLVYRFEEPRAAAGLDTDGDGVFDDVERTSYDDPGAACDQQNVNGTPALIATLPASAAVVDPITGKRVLRFVDDTPGSPAKNQGQVSWYVVAARGASGWVGPMSAPVRGYYADKSAPDRPALEDVTFGVCHPELVATELFDYPFIAYDDTDGGRARGGKLRLYCLAFPNPEVSSLMRMLDGYVGEAPFEPPKEGGGFVVSASDPVASALYDEVEARWVNESCWVYAEVVDAEGRVIAASDPEADLVQRPDPRTWRLAVILQEGCTSMAAEPIQPGQVIDGPIKIGLPAGTPATTCADLEIEDGGQYFRLGRFCGDGLVDFVVPDTGGTLQCYALTVMGTNQQPSLPLGLPCVKAKTSLAPAPPLLDQLILPGDRTEGSLRWKAPGSAVAGIILQLENKTAGTLRSEFVPRDGAADPTTGFAPATLPLGPALAPGANETWCVSARSLSAATGQDIGGQLSSWAGPLCGQRVQDVGALPSYLPWPAMAEPPVRSTPLQAGYLGSDAMPIVIVGSLDPAELWPPPDPQSGEPWGDCGAEEIPTCYSSYGVGEGEPCLHPNVALRSDCIDLCQSLTKAAGDMQRFIGYRQTWDASTSTWGPWIQVTPYVERPFCFFDPDAYRDRVTFTLFDATFAAARFLPLPGDPESFATYRLVWTDRYPHEPGTKIRYQFVRFGSEGQIAETIPTTEVDIPAEVAP